MKRTICIFILVCAAVLVTACNKEMVSNSKDEWGGNLEVSGVFAQTQVTITEEESAISAEWSIGDKIRGFWEDGADVKTLSYTVISVGSSGRAEFALESGTEPSAEGTPVHMILAPGKSCGLFDGNGVAKIDITQQDGSFNSLNNNTIYCATAKVVSGRITFSFVNRTALVDVRNINGTVGEGIWSFSLEGKGMSTGEARLVDGVLDIVPNPVTSFATASFQSAHSLDSPVWMAVLPQEGTRNFKAIATTLSNTFDKTVNTTLAAGTCTDVNTLTLAPRTDVKGGEFTIDDWNGKVQFSRGNLCVTRSNGMLFWNFAPNQFDYIATPGISIDVISDGTFDLFLWSTDATESNWGLCNPDNLSEEFVGGNFMDWAAAKYTRMKTLGTSEWEYLLFERSASTVDNTSDARYFKGTIELANRNVNGLFLLPDSFTKPSTIGNIQHINCPGYNYAENTLTYDEFLALEDAGVVFLPAAGYRNGTTLRESGNYGCYWTSQPCEEYNAKELYFCGSGSDVKVETRSIIRTLGYSVRLVQPIWN